MTTFTIVFGLAVFGLITIIAVLIGYKLGTRQMADGSDGKVFDVQYVTESTTDELTSSVNLWISKGYEPIGEVIFTPAQYIQDARYVQMMVMFDD